MTKALHGATDVKRAGDTLITFGQAAQIIADYASPLGREQVALDHAAGRVLAEDITAGFDSPAWPVSAMDGYAVQDRDLHAIPAELPIVGASFAGHPLSGPLASGTCVRVFTGAMVPHGTERVVIQEDVREENGIAQFHSPLANRRHLRAPGSDFAKGDLVLATGNLLTPHALVGAAAADRAKLCVYRKPMVSILCCGDELVAPGQPGRTPGKIPESISYGISALVEEWGGMVVHRSRQPDDLSLLRRAAAAVLTTSDIVVVVAGASVGEKDFAKAAFADPGFELLFGKVAIKPGKPVWFGRRDKSLVIGLPGNPSAAMVTARLFLAPLVAGLGGRPLNDAWDWHSMRGAMPLETSGDRDVFMRATVKGRVATPLLNQDSAGQRPLACATHLIRCRAGEQRLPASAIVETLKL